MRIRCLLLLQGQETHTSDDAETAWLAEWVVRRGSLLQFFPRCWLTLKIGLILLSSFSHQTYRQGQRETHTDRHTHKQRHHDMSRCTRDTQPHTSHTLTENQACLRNTPFWDLQWFEQTLRFRDESTDQHKAPCATHGVECKRAWHASSSEPAEGPSTRRGNCRPFGRRPTRTWLSPSRSWERFRWGRSTAQLPRKSQTQTCRVTRASARANREELCEKQLPSGRRPPSEPSTLPWRAHR